MKRILPFLLILALIAVQLPYFLAVPVKAADLTYDDLYLELLDYGGISRYVVPDGREWANTGTYFSILGGSSTLYFNLPSLIDIGYIDILVNAGEPSRPITTATAYGKSLNIVRQGEFYRVYGEVGMYDKYSHQVKQLVVTFNSNIDVWCDLLSVKVGKTNNLYFSTTGNGTLTASSTTKTFTFPNSNSATINSGSDTSVLGVLEFDDWTMYDFIDVFFYIITDHIDSFTAWGEDFIPIEYSFVSSSDSSAEGHYLVSARLDLRGLDRLSTDLPSIYFQLMCNANELVQFSVMRCNGLVLTNNSNYLTYWFQKVIASSKANSTSILSGISDAADQIAAAFSSGMASTGEGAIVKDKGSQIGSDMSAAQAQLDAVNKPSGSNITAIDSLGSVGFTANTSYLTQIVNTKYIKEVFVFVAIMAILSLVLFGTKKGG